MKRTLQRFFERTAYSRDASEFLMLYNSVDVERFLLLIPVLRSKQELEDLRAELEYMLELELYPTLLLSEDHFAENLMEELDHVLSQLHEEVSLDVFRVDGGEFLPKLIELGEQRDFHKVVWTGGALLSAAGEVVSRLHLSHLKDAKLEIPDDVLLWLRSYLKKMGQAASVQMVAPDQILPELFTRQGVGTLVSLGYDFSLNPLEQCDRERLLLLLEDGFGRRLRPGYVEGLSKGTKVLVEAAYRGAIILEPWGDVHYLDKVVVKSSYYGRGLGSLLLDELSLKLEELSGQFPKLCWRAKLDNPYLHRYAALVYGLASGSPMCCGTTSDGQYVYHYTGLSFEERESVVEKMRCRGSSFSDDVQLLDLSQSQ